MCLTHHITRAYHENHKISWFLWIFDHGSVFSFSFFSIFRNVLSQTCQRLLNLRQVLSWCWLHVALSQSNLGDRESGQSRGQIKTSVWKLLLFKLFQMYTNTIILFLVKKLQRAALKNPVKIAVNSKYKTVDKNDQKYLFIPESQKVSHYECCIIFEQNDSYLIKI